MLNDTKLKKLKAQEKPYRIADQGGLCIEVRPSGTKLWRVRYRFNKKASMLSLGEYPLISLADARQKQEEVKLLLSKDIDPAQHKQQQKIINQGKSQNSFKHLAEEFAAERLQHKSERYKNQFKASLEKDIYPVLADKDVKDISSADILLIMRNTLKRIRSQSNFGTGEVTAIQNRKFIGSVMRYAIATLRADNDPTYAVRDVIARPEVNHARALTKDERRQIRVRLENYSGTETVKNAGLMLLYTMLRTIEVRRLEWAWVDFESRIINFPKTAMKKSRPHILPISDQVYALLKKQFKNSGNKTYVFPGIYKTDSMLNQMTINRMIENLGVPDISAHDFRATASTLLYEAGYEEKWIEAQLAHADNNKTRASYNHAQYLKQRKLMIQDWANMVDDWLKI